MSRLLKRAPRGCQGSSDSHLSQLRLRKPFLASSVCHTPGQISVQWQDGEKSSFPNAWLRSVVRDNTYFNEGTLLFNHDNDAFPQFIRNPAIIKNAVIVPGHSGHSSESSSNSHDADLCVTWHLGPSDTEHQSHLNLSWLRAQDGSINSQLLASSRKIAGTEPELWDASSHDLPRVATYEFDTRNERVYDIMRDLKRFGVVFFRGVTPYSFDDPNSQGLRDLISCIGQMRQRFHPTDVLKIWTDPKHETGLDKDIYTSDKHPWHCDTTYYSGRSPARLSVLLNNVYDVGAGADKTINYFVDSLRLVGDLKVQDPDVYELLASVPVRLARRRMNVQEECDENELYIYYYDSAINRKLIFTDEKEGTQALFWTLKQAGMDLDALRKCLKEENNNNSNALGRKFKVKGEFGESADAEMNVINDVVEKHYEAFLYFQERYLDNKKYRQEIELLPGMAAMFSNYRTAHCRSEVHPLTRRALSLAFVSDDVYYNRWRILNGEKSLLDDKWLYGCSSEQLEILANRFDV